MSIHLNRGTASTNPLQPNFSAVSLGEIPKQHGRVRLTNHDRWFLIQLYRWFPSILQVLAIIRPETLVRWHRAGFRCYWRWKSRRRGGRPQIETELRALIRLMSMENPFWGVIVGNSIRLASGVELGDALG
jgi:hypothetical protein